MVKLVNSLVKNYSAIIDGIQKLVNFIITFFVSISETFGNVFLLVLFGLIEYSRISHGIALVENDSLTVSFASWSFVFGNALLEFILVLINQETEKKVYKTTMVTIFIGLLHMTGVYYLIAVMHNTLFKNKYIEPRQQKTESDFVKSVLTYLTITIVFATFFGTIVPIINSNPDYSGLPWHIALVKIFTEGGTQIVAQVLLGLMITLTSVQMVQVIARNIAFIKLSTLSFANKRKQAIEKDEIGYTEYSINVFASRFSQFNDLTHLGERVTIVETNEGYSFINNDTNFQSKFWKSTNTLYKNIRKNFNETE